MNKPKVLVLFGGCSAEHDVSVKSAIEVAANIDTDKYDPVFVGITKDGAWKHCEKPSLDWEKRAFRSVALSPDRRTKGLLMADRRDCVICRVDVAFPVMHGALCEDGAIQGLFELANIPYVGCGIEASAICMDKPLTYTVASAAGVAVPKHFVAMSEDDLDGITLTYPVFVKPARSGSSFGVSKVESPKDLLTAVKDASLFDSKVLIEEAVCGKEIGCAVIGSGEDLTVGKLDQIVLSHGFFRIHQEDSPETGSENSNFIVPAAIAASEYENVLREAVKTYRALGCEGLARVDMFLTEDGRVVLNEVNTMPGLTSYSRYPRMMAAAGLPLSKLIDLLICHALERGDR